MGSFLTALLQGVGRTGSNVAEGRLAEEDRKLKLLQSQLGMQELKQKMALSGAPQFVGSHADPTGQLFNTVRDPYKGTLTDLPGGREKVGTWKPMLTDKGYVEHNDVTRESRPMKDDAGNVLQGVPKGKNGIYSIDGKPIGIWHNGQLVTPDHEEWTPQDSVDLARASKTWLEAEEVKNKRIQLSAQSRAWAWMQMPVGVYDADTNSFVEVSRSQVVKNPGKYGPPGPAMQIVNRNRLFSEIDATRGVLNDAITKLPDDAFSPEARFQMAMVLKDENPASAFQEFIHSTAATTLSDQQVEYVTALASMQESAMALRTVGGVPGATTDRIRGAITKMLPGAGTPSKGYAVRQMKLFDIELEALRKNMPSSGRPGGGGETVTPGTPPPGATVIPWDKVK